MLSDLHHALRQLAKSPGFTILAVLSLAVGIGINTTIFSVMDAAFLRPLPVRAPDEIVKFERPALSFTEYEQVRAEMKSLSGLLASGRQNLLLKGNEGTELVMGRTVSNNYFTVLGIAPIAGRVFTERSPDLTQPIAVISDAFWQRRSGRDPELIGRTITLNGQPFTVIGVTPRGFTGEDRLPPTEVWYPVEAQPRERASTARVFRLTGRLQPDTAPAQARAEAATIFARPEWETLGKNRHGEREVVVSEEESRMEHGGRLTYLMGPIVGLVLLVACANVSSLLLGRYEQRRREIAVRLALGAGRWRVMRYLLAEGLLLALGGGALGLLFTAWGVGLVPTLLPPMFTSWVPEMQLDYRTLVMTLGLSIFATLAFGLMPAWRAVRLDISAMLKSDTAHLGKTPSRNVLVVAQVMIAMVFLSVAALLVRGFVAGATRDFGFSERNLLLTHLVPERPRELPLLLDDVRRTVTALPGVRSVTVANRLAGGRPISVRVPGDETAGHVDGQPFPCNSVDTGYFATLGIPLLNGRDFSERDNRGTGRVAIVSEAMAKRFWPGENPVGKTLFAGRNGLAPREVVGVVRDVVDFGERPSTDPLLYLPLRQEGHGDKMLIVQTKQSPTDLVSPVREALRRMDTPTAAVWFDTVAGKLRMQMLPQWFGAWLGGVLGLLAFVLAISGLYGVVAYAVARRTRELGIRVALGAGPRDTIWLVLRQGVTLSLIGVAIGLPLAMAVGKLMQSLLYGISPADPVALVGSALLVIAVAALASWLPARRATRINPVEALRAE